MDFRKMKKICIVTASRSEYGIMRYLINEMRIDKQLILQLVVTGTHLSPEFGLTVSEIENDKINIDEKIEMLLSSNSKVGIVKSMGICSLGIADAFNRLHPDLIIVAGDRFELIPICSAALIMNIPIAHISGGDVTLGAIDNQIRNAITMMSTIHFPGVKDSAKRIKRMIGTNLNIYTVGEPGIESLMQKLDMDRLSLSEEISLDVTAKWILLTYHPETKIGLNKNLETANNIIVALDQMDGVQVIITCANSDFGGSQINSIFLSAASLNPFKYKFFNSLGSKIYINLLNEVEFIIGNSSSGIMEAPTLAIPVINIGDRQKGRYMSNNIINSNSDLHSISKAIIKISTLKPEVDKYWGEGDTSYKILTILKNYLKININ